MQPAQLAGLIFAIEEKIVTAISSGAGWEVWMQNEMADVMRSHNLGVARETAYDPPSEQRLDFLVRDQAGALYAIELKVEGATRAVKGLLAHVLEDRAKLMSYTSVPIGNRWVVGIAYSDHAKRLCAEFAADRTSQAYYFASQTKRIGVLICPI